MVSVEPVFGQINQGREPRQLLLTGTAKVGAEWKLCWLTQNAQKLRVASLG